MRFPIVLRRLSLPLIALGCGLVWVASAFAAETPERVISWRIRMHSTDEYKTIFDQWKAYTEAHPQDPLGWTQLARAARYADQGCSTAVGYARRAVEVDPKFADGHCTLAYAGWSLYCPDSGIEAKEAIRELETALSLDPTNPEPYFTLWVARLSVGNTAGADDCLRGLLKESGIPEPVLDFGYNLLIGLEPNAILITNGDNDTYPPLALQVARQVRPDVAVVNRSLLNTDWYRDLLRSGRYQVPVPPMEKEPKGIPSTQGIQGIVAALAKDGWKRPLYIAATVPGPEELIENGLSLEGLVYRVEPKPSKEGKVDLVRLESNLTRLYRLDSATSLSFDWDWANSVGRLARNYLELYSRLASGLAESGHREQAVATWSAGLRMAEFHHQRDAGLGMTEDWLKSDPASTKAAEWKRQLEAGGGER